MTAVKPAAKTPTRPAAKRAAPQKAAPAAAAKTAAAKPAVLPIKRAKPVKPTQPDKAAAAAKSAKSAVSAKASKVAKPAKVRQKPVRDSFTMPEADFALIAALKARMLSAKRETKKSELLRAGLHALAALDNAALLAALGKLAPVKVGRPKSGH